MRRSFRILGTLLAVGGILTLAWVVVVWQWQDPFTALYTHFQQEHLAHEYDQRAKAFRVPAAHGNLAAVEQQVAREAAAYRKTLHRGHPVGRLKIGRIGLNMIVVQGTDEHSLEKGPGHYIASWLPGQGRLIYIAGHRTTYLAPFAYINEIRNGDYITFQVPYGTFTYRAYRHYVVAANDVAVLQDHGREILRLQACHPRFFATHRYIVDAKLVAFAPRGGVSYSTPTTLAAAATTARS
jgi:sortase A